MRMGGAGLMSHRLFRLGAAATAAGLLAALGGGSVAATGGAPRLGSSPETLVTGKHRIWAFAQHGHRLTWVSRAHLPDGTRCRMYVLTRLRIKPSFAPFPARVRL